MGKRLEAGAAPAAKSIQSAKRELSRSLLRKTGISGVGIVEAGGRPSIMGYLTEDSPQTRSLVPTMVDGYPVVMKTVGAIHAHS